MISKKMFILIPFLLFTMASGPVFIPELEERLFDIAELAVISSTLETLGLEYGYNYEFKIEYITYASDYNEAAFQSRKHGLFKVIQPDIIVLLRSIHNKLYRLSLITEIEMNDYKTTNAETFKFFKEHYFDPEKKYLKVIANHLKTVDKTFIITENPDKLKIKKDVMRRNSKRSKFGDNFLSKEEVSILNQTTQAIDYDYGYDNIIDLSYIFSFSYSDKNFSQKEKDFSAIVNRIESNILELYVIKINKIYHMTEYKLKYFKKRAEWKYYTFIKNELLPPLEKYKILLEKYSYKRNPALRTVIEKEKKKNIKWILWYYSDDADWVYDF